VRRLLALVAACAGGPAVSPPPVHSTPKPAPEVAWDKLVGPIKAIEIRGDDPNGRIKTQLAGVVGKPIDRGEIRAVLGPIIEAGAVGDVRVGGVQRAEGITLVIELVPQPKIHAFAAHDAGGGEVTLPAAAKVAVGMRLDPKMLDGVVSALREDYVGRGYVDAAVAWHTTASGDQVDVSIDVTPGVATTVAGREFHGNAHAPAADLDAAIGKDILVAGSPWHDDEVERAALLISAYYYDHGYVNVRIPTPQPAGGKSPVVFDISEGDQFKMGKITVKNADAEKSKRYLALLQLKKGDVFKRSVIADAIEKIRTMSGKDVLPLTTVDTDHKTIDLTLELDDHH
jgi:outer membrane protein assembly factor BamA